MTKQDLARELETRTNLSHSQAIQAVEQLIDIVADALAGDEPILLRGFGTIKTVQRAPRLGRDISKGKTIHLPSTRQVKFIAYNDLKERINHHGHSAVLP